MMNNEINDDLTTTETFTSNTEVTSEPLHDKTLAELEKHYGEPWESPILFEEINTPTIPASLLPSILGEYAAALANATETPEAMSVMSVLTILSVALAKKVVVSPKVGWQEPVNLYSVIALPPANNKSFVLKSCTQPLLEWEQEQEQLQGAHIRREWAEYKTQEKIIEGLRARAAKAKTQAEQQQLKAEVAELETNLTPPPVLPHLFGNDLTPEALVTRTYEQGGRYAVLTDEGGIMETLSGLYTHNSANIDILLKGIDGGVLRVDRKDRRIQLNPYLTCLFIVQPSVIQTMMSKPAFRGNGFLDRFLYVLPKSNLGYRTHDKPPVSPALQLAYNQKIKSLLAIEPVLVNGNEQPRVLSLTSEALKAWQDFQHDIETKLRPGGELAHYLGWGGKLCGFTLRIAGLLHVAEQGVTRLTISEDSMDFAIAFARLLIPHMIAAFSLSSIDTELEDAKEVFQWIKAKGLTRFTQSKLTYDMRNRNIRKEGRLGKAIQLLIDRNMLRSYQVSTPFKPTCEYHVNPAIYQDEHDN